MSINDKLTPVEWEIMETVWQLGGSPSVRDVLAKAYPDSEKAYTTVQTIMNTLVKKGLLISQKIGLVNFYTPVKSRNDMVQSELKNMLSRVFNGSAPAMANYLLDSQDLSLEEIQKIKDLLTKKAQKLQD
ncbi:MAG TPA: BlaI/MecI/CopY family transcriptional regulator [bacterium]|nr:BlaI/MecI/CopY family transcriptional regulator [bacterium]